MQPAIRNIVIGLASTLCLMGSAHAENFDGRWEGTYSCGAHRYKPLPPFSWQIPFEVRGSSISARRDYNIANQGGIAATAIFSGTRDRDGRVRIDVMARREDNAENFHQALLGNSTSQTGMALTGSMVGAKGVSVRDCQLTLRPAVPAPAQAPAVADAELGRLEAQKSAIKAEGQRVAQTAKQVADAKRAADAKAAEAARRQAEELKLAAEATLKRADETRRSAPPVQGSVNITMVQLNLLPKTERRED